MMTFTRVALAGGGWWTPLVVRGFPDMDRVDDRVTIEVELPAGSGHGPALDFDALVEYGRISDRPSTCGWGWPICGTGRSA